MTDFGNTKYKTSLMVSHAEDENGQLEVTFFLVGTWNVKNLCNVIFTSSTVMVLPLGRRKVTTWESAQEGNVTGLFLHPHPLHRRLEICL